MKLTKLLTASALLVCGAQIASAVPMLRLTSNGPSGITSVTITDNLLGDLDPAPGAVSAGTISLGDFNLTLSVGLADIGSDTSPIMDVLSFSMTSNSLVSDATLTIEFSDIGFGPTQGTGGRMSIGGHADVGTDIVYTAYADGGNNYFAQTEAFDTISFYGLPGGGFSGDGAGTSSEVANTPYSLTQVIEITHPAGAMTTSSFDALLEVPDGGTTVSLLGLTLLGLGAGRRALRK